MIPPGKVIAKRQEGTQYAALCFRRTAGQKPQVLLITSRGTGRWIPPKGWPIEGLSPAESAAQEALEEAGVTGQTYPAALGRYKYNRLKDRDKKKSSEAYIFALRVTAHRSDFKEKGQRRIQWFDQKTAALLVREPKLRQIIADFDPDLLDSNVSTNR